MQVPPALEPRKAYYLPLELSIVVAGMGLLFLVSVHSYLLFHSLVELFSIVVACGIFMFVWNSRRFIHDGFFLVLGISSLFVAGLDALHTLSYEGLRGMHGENGNLPTQLWAAARYMQTVSLLVAVLMVGRRVRVTLIWAVFVTLFTLLLLSIYQWHVFPDCYVEGRGLTPFKIDSEYTYCLILTLTAVLLVRRSQAFSREVLIYFLCAIFLTINAELSMAKYVNAFGWFNEVGHFLKLGAFYLIYKAVIEIGLAQPYAIMFRDLERSRAELQESLAHVKTLSGLLPICASCKKIRDDQGYWNQLEVYIRDHSEAEFSHSICPACAKKLYPDLDLGEEK